jgi:hypothetical protein
MLTTNLRTSILGLVGALGAVLVAVGSPPWLVGLGHALIAVGTAGVGFLAADAAPPKLAEKPAESTEAK